MSLRNALYGIYFVLLSLPLDVFGEGTVAGPAVLCIGTQVTYTVTWDPPPPTGYSNIWSSSSSKVTVIDSENGVFEGVGLSTATGDVTISVDDSLGNIATTSVTVVELKRIVITAGGSGNSDDNNSAGNAAPVCADNPVTFTAVMTNVDIGGSGVEWSVQPPGGGGWQPQGAGKESTLTLSPPGNYEVKAECGSKSVVIYVVALKVEITITQGDRLWWFNGEDVADYDESATLTAQGATTGTFKWA